MKDEDTRKILLCVGPHATATQPLKQARCNSFVTVTKNVKKVEFFTE